MLIMVMFLKCRVSTLHETISNTFVFFLIRILLIQIHRQLTTQLWRHHTCPHAHPRPDAFILNMYKNENLSLFMVFRILVSYYRWIASSSSFLLTIIIRKSQRVDNAGETRSHKTSGAWDWLLVSCRQIVSITYRSNWKKEKGD